MGILSGYEHPSRHLTFTLGNRNNCCSKEKEKIISYSSHKKKQHQEQETTAETRIKHLACQYTNTPSEQIQNEITQFKTQLETIVHKKTVPHPTAQIQKLEIQ